jgi:hypothetical protein
MPLYNIKTKVSSQAAALSSLLPDKKQTVEKSGFSQSATNAAGSQIPTIPSAVNDPVSKDQSLFFSDYNPSLYSVSSLQTLNDGTVSFVEDLLKKSAPIFEESKISSDFAISSKMPEPLAIFSFKKDEVENILSAVYQSYIEDACSQKFLERIFQVVRQGDPNFFDSIEKSISLELSEAQSIIDTLDSIISQINLFNQSLNLKSRNNANFEKYLFLEYAKIIAGGGNDTEGRQNELIGSLNSIFQYISKNSASVQSNEKSQTAIITQLLHVASIALRNGSSSLVLGEKIINIPAGSSTISQKTIKDSQTSKLLKLSELSTKSDKNSCYIYGIPGLPETAPYTSIVDLSSLSDVKNIRKAAYLTCLIAQEFTLSAGLGRLQGTPIGDKFLTDENYLDNFFGTLGLSGDAHSETKRVDSLVDALVVSSDGSTRALYGSKKVLLFDGTSINPSETTTNSVSEFLGGMTKNPSDENFNKIKAFEKSMNNANKSFSEGTDFLKNLYSTDTKLSLLSPRGLYTRLLKTFATYLNSFADDNLKNAPARMELAMMSLVAKYTNSAEPNDPGNIVKRYMLSCMAKTAISGVRFNDVNSWGLIAKNENKQPAKQGEYNFGQPIFPTLSKGKIRFSNDDTKLIKEIFNKQDLTEEFLFSFFKISSKSASFFGPSNFDISMSPLSTFSDSQQIYFNNSSFLDGISQIFVDLVKEAESLAVSNKPSESTAYPLVDEDGFTKNFKLDATIVLGALLESACILADAFVEVQESNTASNAYATSLLSNSAGTGKIMNKQTKDALKNTQLQLLATMDKQKIKEAVSVLNAICAASETDDLNSLTIIQGGTEVIPKVQNLPIQTVISKKSSGISAAVLIELLKDLGDERNLPIAMFSSAKSLVLSANEASLGVVKTGKQLLGSEKPTQEIKNFLKFSQTELAKEYFSSLNEFTLLSSKQIFSEISDGFNSPSKKNQKLNAGIYNCLSVILPEITSKKDDFVFLVAGLPNDYVKNSLKIDFSAKIDKNSEKSDEIMKVSVEKKPVFSKTSYENLSFDTYIRPVLRDQSFSQFTENAKQFPVSFADIVNKCILDNGKTGLKEKSTKINQAIAQEILENEVVSYLLKKMFSVLSSSDLFESIISTKNFQIKSSNSQNLARKFSEVYGLSPSTFDSVFSSSEEFGTVLDKQQILNLSFEKISDASSSIVIEPAKISFGEAEIFYDLFSTIYFMEGRLKEIIFSPTVLDRTVGVLFSPSEFKVYQLDPEDSSSASGTSNAKCTIDSYSLDVVLSTPLENA